MKLILAALALLPLACLPDLDIDLSSCLEGCGTIQHECAFDAVECSRACLYEPPADQDARECSLDCARANAACGDRVNGCMVACVREAEARLP